MKKLFLLALMLFNQNSYADKNSNALLETQKLLRSPERMQKEASVNPKAANADRNAAIVTLGKPELKQDLFDISADLMAWIVEATKGDPTKMQELVNDAANNPRAFYDKIPASEREKIKALSEKIESSRKINKYP